MTLNSKATQLPAVAVNAMTVGNELADSSMGESITTQMVEALVHAPIVGTDTPHSAPSQSSNGQDRPVNPDEIEIITVDSSPDQSMSECAELQIGFCQL